MRPIEVTIERDGALIDRVERLPRHLPDGSIGVEYLGLVYPLISAGRASLDGRWCYPSEAPLCLQPPDNLPSDDKRFWFLDQAGTRSYLFLNGSEALLSETVKRLGKAGLTVEHFGPSFREGESGLLHDWFIRLPTEDEITDWELSQILAGVEAPTEEVEANLSPEHSLIRARRENERLVQRLIDAERELAATVAHVDQADAEIVSFRKSAKREAQTLQTELAFLRAGIAAFEQAEDSSSDRGELEQLRSQVDELSADRDAALEAWTEAERRADSTRAELEAARAEAEEQRAQNAPEQRRPTLSARRRQRAQAELKNVLDVLLSGIELVRGSEDFILTELDDRRDLYAKLRQLADDPVALGGKRVHAAEGWLEVHLSTGRARDGRLYYKRGENVWFVLVSDKAAQANDFQWLKTQ